MLNLAQPICHAGLLGGCQLMFQTRGPAATKLLLVLLMGYLLCLPLLELKIMFCYSATKVKFTT